MFELSPDEHRALTAPCQCGGCMRCRFSKAHKFFLEQIKSMVQVRSCVTQLSRNNDGTPGWRQESYVVDLWEHLAWEARKSYSLTPSMFSP